MFKRELVNNKICALSLILLGVVASYLDSDITFLVFTTIVAIPLFLSKKDWIS